MKNKSSSKSLSKKIKPAFGYFGSKASISKELISNLPPHNCWVELFCGSAALTLSKAPSSIEVINDLDNEITNLFTQLRNNSDELCKVIEMTPYARQELINSRENDPNENELEKARKFLVRSMFAINSSFGKAKGGFSYSNSYSRKNQDARVSRWNNLPDRLLKVAERFKNIRIENRDAIDLLKMYQNRPATLLYLDPPYLGDRVKGYEIDADAEEFHHKLLSVANKSRSMLFISGYKNKLYEQLLSEKNGWQNQEIQTSTRNSKGQIFDRTEVVWFNSYFQKALKENKVPITLTSKEQKNKKINPVRN